MLFVSMIGQFFRRKRGSEKLSNHANGKGSFYRTLHVGQMYKFPILVYDTICLFAKRMSQTKSSCRILWTCTVYLVSAARCTVLTNQCCTKKWRVTWYRCRSTRVEEIVDFKRKESRPVNKRLMIHAILWSWINQTIKNIVMWKFTCKRICQRLSRSHNQQLFKKECPRNVAP